MDAFDQGYNYVAEEVKNIPEGTNSAIVMTACKKFLADYLLWPSIVHVRQRDGQVNSTIFS